MAGPRGEVNSYQSDQGGLACGFCRIRGGTPHLLLIHLGGLGLPCQALAYCGAVVLPVDVNPWDFDKAECITPSMITASFWALS